MQVTMRILTLSLLLAASLLGQGPVERATQLNRQRKYREALRILRPLVVSANPPAAAMAEAGRANMGMRKLARATDLLLIAHQMEPENPGYLYDLASGLFNQGRYQEALPHWQILEGLEIPANTPQAQRAWQLRKASISFSLGETARHLDHTPTAIGAYRRAIDLAQPGSKEAAQYREALGGILLNAGRYGEALSHFDWLVQHHPSVANHHFHRGVALMELKRYKDAEDALVAARRLDPKLAEAPLKLGNLFLRLKDYARADGYFEIALSINPLAGAGWFGRARTARFLGNEEEAKTYRKKYKELSTEASKIEEELRDLRRRAMKNSSDVAASMRAAEIFLSHKHTEEALEAYNRVLAVDRTNDVAILNTAMILLGMGRRLDAYWELEKILERNPNHPYANLESGRLLLAGGKISEGMLKLQRCVNELDPARRATCHQLLAFGYQKMGDIPNAKKHLAEAKSWRATAAGDGR